jgi:hypothetical protein
MFSILCCIPHIVKDRSVPQFWMNMLPPTTGLLILVKAATEVTRGRKSFDLVRKAARTVANLNYTSRRGD